MPPLMTQSTLEPDQITHLRSIPAAVERLDMHGMAQIVNALVVALLTDGHVLLEGNPGLGKTALVRALSAAVGYGRGAVGRIQFTPDLMPADITGTLMPDNGALVFKPGPIFCSLLLADEINRATAKTQSAMLEAMAEGQVTVLGETRPLRHWRNAQGVTFRTPFIVMATQNPIEQDGTNALPEAQADRFMFKVNMAMPAAPVLDKIIAKAMKPDTPPRAQAAQDDVVQVQNAMAVMADIGSAILDTPLSDQVRVHITNIVHASNAQWEEVRDISSARLSKLRTLAERITYPLGPRAASALARASGAWAAVVLVPPQHAGTDTPVHQRRALAEICLPVLRHRLRVETDYAAAQTPRAEAEALDRFIRDFVAACAPDGERGAYARDFGIENDHAATEIRL